MKLPEYMRDRVSLGLIMAVAFATLILTKAMPYLIIFLVEMTLMLGLSIAGVLLAYSALREYQATGIWDYRGFFSRSFDPVEATHPGNPEVINDGAEQQG